MIIKPIKITDKQHSVISLLFFLITDTIFIALYPTFFRHYFGAFFYRENIVLVMIGLSSLNFLMSFLLEETLSRTVLTCLAPYGLIFSAFVFGKVLLSGSKLLLAAEALIITAIFILCSVRRKKRHKPSSTDDFFEKSISDFIKDMGSSIETAVEALFICLSINIPVGIAIMLLLS